MQDNNKQDEEANNGNTNIPNSDCNSNEDKLESESAEQKINEIQKRLLLEMAELENMRKRSEKQIKEASDYAISSFAKDLMSVMDNLEKALDHHGASKDCDNDVENIILGIEMTKNELNSVFSKYGLLKILPNVGDKFNYEIHQAISYEESEEFGINTISKVMQSGYKLRDRLLRPAMVVVSKGKQ